MALEKHIFSVTKKVENFGRTKCIKYQKLLILNYFIYFIHTFIDLAKKNYLFTTSIPVYIHYFTSISSESINNLT